MFVAGSVCRWPAAAGDVRSAAANDERGRGRHGRKIRGVGPAGAAGLSPRRRPTHADQPESDLPGREGFSQRSRWKPPRGSVLAEPVPESDFGSVYCVCRTGGMAGSTC